MTQKNPTLTLLLDHPGFPPVAEQRSACHALEPNDGAAAGTGTERVITAPDVHDWQLTLESVLDGVAPGDTVRVPSLSVLAPSCDDLLQNLATAADRQAHLLHADDVGASAASELLTCASVLLGAVRQSQDHLTRAALAEPTPARGVTPPHARAVALASYRRVAAAG